MRLLSANDCKAIQRAMDQRKPLRLEMVYRGSYRIEVLVEPAPPVWGQSMLIRVREWRRREPDGAWSDHLSSTQNFCSVDELLRFVT